MEVVCKYDLSLSLSLTIYVLLASYFYHCWWGWNQFPATDSNQFHGYLITSDTSATTVSVVVVCSSADYIQIVVFAKVNQLVQFKIRPLLAKRIIIIVWERVGG